MASDGFPGAIWIPAHTDRYARRDSRIVDEIVEVRQKISRVHAQASLRARELDSAVAER